MIIAEAHTRGLTVCCCCWSVFALEVVVKQMFALGCNVTSSDVYSNNACVVLRQASVCTAGVLYEWSWYNTCKMVGPANHVNDSSRVKRCAIPTGNWIEAGRYDEYSMSWCERVYVE